MNIIHNCVHRNNPSLSYSRRQLETLRYFKHEILYFFAEIPPDAMHDFDARLLRKIEVGDFFESLKRVRRSVPTDSLERYLTWNMQYGDITT